MCLALDDLSIVDVAPDSPAISLVNTDLDKFLDISYGRLLDWDSPVKSRYLMPAISKVQDFFNEIAADMMLTFGISIEEAVARINQHWRGQEFPEEEEIIFHEDAHYWAMVIYYEEVPDWNPEADRSHWMVRPKPPSDSECWTIGTA